MADRETLLDRYSDLLQSCGVSNPYRHARAMADAYSQPHRAYHNGAHVVFMLDRLDDDILNHELELTDFEKRCIKFAIWWHDYVYEPMAKDNETQSINAWETFVSGHPSTLGTYKSSVSYLIERTISHTRPTSVEARELISPDLVSYFLDLDLAILGSTREVYQIYADSIRREYIQYSIDDYRKGRIDILERFLKRESIFISLTSENIMARAKDIEDRARENIIWELGELNSGSLPKI